MARKLKEIFKYKFEILRRALDTNDVDEARRILKKNDDFFADVIMRFDHGKQTKEMAEMFIRDFGDKDWERWGFKPDTREISLRLMLQESMLAGRTDLVDTYFGAGLSFRTGKAGRHEIATVLKSPKMEASAKTALVQRFIEAGIDKVENPRGFLDIAIENNAPAAFDLLAKATKEDTHKDNEALLRHAGEKEQADMVRHLVLHHAANIDLAITTERTLGHDKVWHFLEEQRQQIRPGESAPPTLDSLAAEMRALKNELLGVKEELAALRGQQPGPAFKGA